MFVRCAVCLTVETSSPEDAPTGGHHEAVDGAVRPDGDVVCAAAFAQGGGASSTGTIQGRVADAQGAVLPGVTVTATSPALIQPQTTVTSETGNYRFPAVPPGTYAVSFELAGFTTLKRDGIAITLGFTAQVNAELALATAAGDA